MALPSKHVILVLKIVTSATLLSVVLVKTGLDNIYAVFRSINVAFFLFSVLMYLATLYLSSIRWRLLLDEHPGGKRLFSLYLIGAFFNHILPGIIGGDAVKAYYLYKGSGNSISAIASVFMDRYVGFTALMLVGLTAFPFGFHHFRGTYIELLLPAIVLLFLIGSIAVFGLKIGRGIKFLSGFYEYFLFYRSRTVVLAKALGISIILQLMVICSIYMLSRGLLIDIPLLSLCIFVPIITTISTAPISISGLGVREASCVLLFGTIGIGPAQATAVSLSWYLSVAMGSLPGLIEYLRHRGDVQ